jgi:hypothetical protein
MSKQSDALKLRPLHRQLKPHRAFESSDVVLKSGQQVQQIRRNLAILPGPNEQASGIHRLREERDQFGSNEFSTGTRSFRETSRTIFRSSAMPRWTDANVEELVLAGLVFTCVLQSSPDAFGSCKKCISRFSVHARAALPPSYFRLVSL